MTIQISKVFMPNACISCQVFCPKGYAEDQHSPFTTKFDQPSLKLNTVSAVKQIAAYLLPKFATATSKNQMPTYLR